MTETTTTTTTEADEIAAAVAIPVSDDNVERVDENGRHERNAWMWKLYDEYKKESNALDAWEARRLADPKFRGKRPSTTNKDRYEQILEEDKNIMAKSTTKTPKQKTPIVYFHNGLPMATGHEAKLSTFAYLFTKDVKPNTPRISTADFIDLLKKLGVDDPHTPGWMVDLPNGVTIEARTPGEAPKCKPKEPAAKTTKAAKKSPAKKSPAKKSAKKAPAKKAPAKKATAAKKSNTHNKKVSPGEKARQAAKRDVNPIPKTGAKKAVAAARTTRRSVKK